MLQTLIQNIHFLQNEDREVVGDGVWLCVLIECQRIEIVQTFSPLLLCVAVEILPAAL